MGYTEDLKFLSKMNPHTITTNNITSVLFTDKDGRQVLKIEDDAIYVYGERAKNADDVVQGLREFLRGHGLPGEVE